MLRRRQRGRRVPKQTIACNQVFGHARRERGDGDNSDRIENGVAKTGRNLKTQMGRRRRTFTAACTPRRWVHSSLPPAHADAVAASHHHPSPLLGASVSVGETGVWDRRGWRVVLAARNAVARTHLLVIVLIVLVQTLVVIILILKVLVFECFAGEEVDRARNNLGCTSVNRLLRKKWQQQREER